MTTMKHDVIAYVSYKITNPELLAEVEHCMHILIDDLIVSEQEYLVPLSVKTHGLSWDSLISECKNKHKKNNQNDLACEIPGGVVIGAVETACGALLWLTPLRHVGTGLMVDGVRRMLDAADEENEKQAAIPSRPEKQKASNIHHYYDQKIVDT